MHQCLTTPETHLRGDNDILAAWPKRFCQEFLGLTAGVHIRGIEMVYAGVQGLRDKFIGELWSTFDILQRWCLSPIRTSSRRKPCVK